jgi:cell division protein FtsB
MGFWRGVGYFFAILFLIAGIFLTFVHSLIGIPLIIGAIIFIWILKKSGQVASIQKDMRYIADSERRLDQELADREQEIEDPKQALAEDQKILEHLEAKKRADLERKIQEYNDSGNNIKDKKETEK